MDIVAPPVKLCFYLMIRIFEELKLKYLISDVTDVSTSLLQVF